MGYLGHILSCNQKDSDHFIPFTVDGRVSGWLKKPFAERLHQWPQVFEISATEVRLHRTLNGFNSRTIAMTQVTDQLVAEGVIERRHGEQYPVTLDRRDQAIMLIDRAAAPYFGIRVFGQHLNGYVRRGNEILMWIAKRSEHKWDFPGKLDNLVGGGLPFDLSPQKNLIKECQEEASIPLTLANQARSVGVVTHCSETDKGLSSEVIYCYDLELPDDFVPVSNDGEVEDFYLWPLDKVAQIVRDTEAFKMNCNLVIIDFLIRHGYLGPESNNYLQLVAGLHTQPGITPSE